jgi:hypothetical protein
MKISHLINLALLSPRTASKAGTPTLLFYYRIPRAYVGETPKRVRTGSTECKTGLTGSVRR